MNDKQELVTSNQSDVAAKGQLPTISPAVDIYENDNEILLHADMPGIKKEDIAINIDNGKLYVSGIRQLNNSGAMKWYEFGDARYSRVFSVPQSIDISKVTANLEEGVLHLHLPKSETAKPRQIKITAS